MLDTYIKWIEAHERLLLVAVAGLVLWFGIGKIDTLIANHDHAALQQAQVVAQQAADKTAAVAEQVARQAAQYQVLAEKLQQQNAQLEQANVQMSLALAQRQKTDAGLPPSELVNRWSTLVPQAKPTVTPTGVAMDTPSAVATVQQLEEIPIQKETIKNTQTELSNSQALLASSNQQVSLLNSEIGLMKTQAVADVKVCTDEKAVLKAEARKGKMHWFEAGVVVGFVGRQLIKVGL